MQWTHKANIFRDIMNKREKKTGKESRLRPTCKLKMWDIRFESAR